MMPPKSPSRSWWPSRITSSSTNSRSNNINANTNTNSNDRSDDDLEIARKLQEDADAEMAREMMQSSSQSGAIMSGMMGASQNQGERISLNGNQGVPSMYPGMMMFPGTLQPGIIQQHAGAQHAGAGMQTGGMLPPQMIFPPSNFGSSPINQTQNSGLSSPKTPQQRQQEENDAQIAAEMAQSDMRNAMGGIFGTNSSFEPGMMSGMPPGTGNYQGGGGPSDMLWIICEINGAKVEMMIDTGAQSSVISTPLLRTLNLQDSPKINRSYQGVAAGVGSARITGKLQNIPVYLGEGHVEFALDFIIIDVQENLLMLGLDQMRRFKCLVDLEKDVLVFGGRGGVEVPFLPPDTSSMTRGIIPGMQGGRGTCGQM